MIYVLCYSYSLGCLLFQLFIGSLVLNWNEEGLQVLTITCILILLIALNH